MDSATSTPQCKNIGSLTRDLPYPYKNNHNDIPPISYHNDHDPPAFFFPIVLYPDLPVLPAREVILYAPYSSNVDEPGTIPAAIDAAN